MFNTLKELAGITAEMFRYRAYLKKGKRPQEEEIASKVFSAIYPLIDSCSPNYGKKVIWANPITETIDTGNYSLKNQKLQKALNQESASDLSFSLKDIDSGRTDLWGVLKFFNSVRESSLLLFVSDIAPDKRSDNDIYYMFPINTFPYCLDYFLKKERHKKPEQSIVHVLAKEAATGFESALQSCLMVSPSDCDQPPQDARTSMARTPSSPHYHGLH